MADSLFTELKRRNVFKVASAYLVLSWLVIQITDAAVPALHLPEWVNSLVFLLGAIGFPFALFFAWAFELTPDGIKREEDVDRSKSIATDTGRKMNYIVISLLVLAVGYLGYNNYHLSTSNEAALDVTESTSSSEPQSQQSIPTKVISLAVLPFVNMSNDPEQEYFVDGLTEELLNSLTRIQGLKVTARTSSFAYKSKNIDMRQIAEELGVDYLVEGSVRKAGTDLRITLQLIEAKDGTHLLSETFDRKLTNVFALQEEISTQVAAALKLTLVHKSDQYNSALETLDYIAVEQLVSARAQIREYAEEPIKIALDALQKLNTQYPNTPEIMGLKVYGQMMLSSVGEFTRVKKGEMSEIKAVLALDSRNKDALYSAAVIYDDDAHTLQQAKEAYQKLIRFYPGDGELYLRMLEYLVSTASPCSELQTFSKTIPEGILDANDTRYVSSMLGACNMSDDPSLTNTSSDDAEQYLRANAWFSADSYYEYISYRHAENPNERFKAVLGALSQNAGASEQAAKFMNEVDHSRVSYWAMYKINSGAIYNIEYDIDPVEFYEANPTLNNHGTHIFGVGRTKYAVATENKAFIINYLKNVTAFPINAATTDQALGLMVMQYHAGYEIDSSNTAKAIHESLLAYAEKHPNAFKAYKLWPALVYSAFYSGRAEEVNTIINTYSFVGDELWIQSPERASFVLEPWQSHPAAIRFIDMIKDDQIRMRNKFGL